MKIIEAMLSPSTLFLFNGDRFGNDGFFHTSDYEIETFMKDIYGEDYDLDIADVTRFDLMNHNDLEKLIKAIDSRQYDGAKTLKWRVTRSHRGWYEYIDSNGGEWSIVWHRDGVCNGWSVVCFGIADEFLYDDLSEIFWRGCYIDFKTKRRAMRAMKEAAIAIYQEKS